jgi:hypothetical protein
MPDPIQTGSAGGDALDVSHIDDPNVRRALKSIHTQMTGMLHRQQLEIDAMLALMMEKHVASIGEFKRELVRLQQDQSRSQRLHAALTGAPAHAPMTRGIH